MSGDHILGPYVIAVQLTELLSALPIALMSSLFPALSQSASDPPRFDRYLCESYRFLLIVACAVCAVITTVATPFIQLFYGKGFLATVPLLIVLVWSEVPIFFAAVLGSAMIAKNLQRHMPLGAAAGALMNILLNLWAIPRYGALGASWATVVSYAFVNVFYLLIISEVRPLVNLGLRVALRPFLLALFITIALRTLPLGFWFKLALAFVAYPVGSLLLGTIGKSDFEQLRRMVRLKS
jgi:O-antigen/teichoic acid export membrane protein